MFDRYRIRGAIAVIVLTAVVGGPEALTSQSVSTAGPRGRITDTEGTPVEAALVTLTHTPTGATSTTLSGAGGRCSLLGRRPGGPYRISVTHIGYRDFARADIELLLGRFVDLEIVLVSEAVNIEGEAIGIEGPEVDAEPDPDFNPDRIGIATLVTSEVLSELPTLTRDFVDFAALSPLSRVSEDRRRGYRWPAATTASTP